MSNIKYTKKYTARVTIFALLIASWIVFKIFGMVLDGTAKETISNIESIYSSRIKMEEKLNINELVSQGDEKIFRFYDSYNQPAYTKYELLNVFKKYFTLENNGFPYNYKIVNLNNSKLTAEDLDFRSSLILTDKKLTYKGNLYEIKNPAYESQGTFAIYFNDTLQYSSTFPLNETKKESLGSHFFFYRFSESKQLFFRVVYKFKNTDTHKTEYFISEKLLVVNH